jgi:hypothetical protein
MSYRIKTKYVVVALLGAMATITVGAALSKPQRIAVETKFITHTRVNDGTAPTFGCAPFTQPIPPDCVFDGAPRRLDRESPGVSKAATGELHAI